MKNLNKFLLLNDESNSSQYWEDLIVLAASKGMYVRYQRGHDSYVKLSLYYPKAANKYSSVYGWDKKCDGNVRCLLKEIEWFK